MIRVRNAGTLPLNFAFNPATLTVNVTGGTVATLGATITSGTLAVNATMDVTMSGTLNMNAMASYTFNINATVVGDGNVFNNNLSPVTMTKVFTVGTVSASNTKHCASAPAPP